MNNITLSAPAKLNFSLDIVGMREDDYHLLEMITQAVSLCDIVKITKTDNASIEISCKGVSLGNDSDNIAYKAAIAFFEIAGLTAQGIAITIEKNIPIGAGMGGGSADAAAVLVGLNLLFDTEFSEKILMEIGKGIGADIPFCIHGGTAFVEGIGEKITKLADFPHCHIVVAKPSTSVNTRTAFKAYDDGKITVHPNTDFIIDAIKWQDILTASNKFCNVFEQTVNIPENSYIKEQMQLFGGLNPTMTGSGSAVFSIFTDEQAAIDCYFALCDSSINAYICEPIKTGPYVI